jgi:hypothetical protein
MPWPEPITEPRCLGDLSLSSQKKTSCTIQPKCQLCWGPILSILLRVFSDLISRFLPSQACIPLALLHILYVLYISINMGRKKIWCITQSTGCPEDPGLKKINPDQSWSIILKLIFFNRKSWFFQSWGLIHFSISNQYQINIKINIRPIPGSIPDQYQINTRSIPDQYQINIRSISDQYHRL